MAARRKSAPRCGFAARHIRKRGTQALLAALLAAATLGAGIAHADPTTPTLDPSDTQCYRGAIYCPPPLYSQGDAPCAYVLGRWVTPFGRDCASGSGWHRAMDDDPACVDDPPHVCAPGNPEGKPAACYDQGGVIVELWPCEPVSDGVYAPALGGAQ